MNELSESEKKRMEKLLSEFDDPNSEVRKRFRNSQDYWDNLFAPLEKAIENFEKI